MIQIIKFLVYIILITSFIQCSTENNEKKYEINIILFNQSGEIKTDMTLFINGKKVFTGNLDEYESVHKLPLLEKQIKLSPGKYLFSIYSKKAKTLYTKNVNITKKCWIIITFWYETELGLYPKPEFTIKKSDIKPIFI